MTRPYKLLKSESVKDILKMPDKIPLQSQIVLSVIQNSKKDICSTEIYEKTTMILPRRTREILSNLATRKIITRRKCECGNAFMYTVRKN